MVLLALAVAALTGCRATPEGKILEEVFPLTETDADADGYTADVDCDDADPTVNPGTIEVCNDLDDDCDGAVDDEPSDGSVLYADADGDGYGDVSDALLACPDTAGRVVDSTDCDDADARVNPGADEPDCTDPVDYNCDGSVGYADADADGFAACEDCDDANPAINPDGVEVCNDADDDCDGTIDEDASDASAWYTDADGDGYGDTLAGTSCDAPEGAVALDGDCNDADAAYNPGATESDCSDANDYNCDGSVGYADTDGDGFAACEECDDTNADVSPLATEACNGVDDDCDGTVDEPDASGTSTWYADNDGDGFGDASTGVTACEAPAGFVADATDCDDTASGSYPGATEVCNGFDDDCDGSADESGALGETTWYTDADADGYGDAAVVACDAPSGASATGGDCDDAAAAVNPGATEACNDIDDDCDGSIDEAGATGEQTWYTDGDGDGYGSTVVATQCDAPTGAVSTDGDCDDGAASVNPGAAEACNSVDDDCDGAVDEAGASGESTWYADADGDGYGDDDTTSSACSAPSGYVSVGGDCSPVDNGIYPGAAEDCNATDDDCDGTVDDGASCPCAVEYDADGDAYMFCTASSVWTTADATCDAYGYTLVAIDDATENTWVVDTAYGYSYGKWWTGYADRATEGTWVWSNGSTSTYTNWASGEPNDSVRNEDCMQLGRYLDYTWNDEPCNTAFPFVCEG